MKYLLAYEDGTDCYDTLAFTLQTPVNHPEETIRNSEHGESLKSRSECLTLNTNMECDEFSARRQVLIFREYVFL
jgi:hypothetical protein